MSGPIIRIDNMKKVYKVHHREEGFWNSFKSVFNRKYKQVEAVSGINLQVNKGEIRGLIGPNGAGKSTTIKIMSGVLHPSTGDVRVMGMVPWQEREKFVRNLGIVFGQKSQLWWDLPAVDTFALQKEMFHIPAEAYAERLAYLANLLKIEDVMTKPVRQLSLGERMKCELVCALLHEPPLIFLDEPTIGMDVISKETMRQFIKQVNREKGTTFIITTHDLGDLEDLCEKVTIINKGTVVYDDTLDNLSRYFSDKKLIEVKFVRPVTREMLEGFNVKSFDPMLATLEIELQEGETIQGEINEIFNRLPVKDINIHNIRIEEVIKQIYSA